MDPVDQKWVRRAVGGGKLMSLGIFFFINHFSVFPPPTARWTQFDQKWVRRAVGEENWWV